jgi:GNAT superfamily N-acetyltransferase
VADVVVRRADDTDLPAILELASAALGWREGEPNEQLFAWKHQTNPFGVSPMWVAEIGGELAGFRTFMRWEWQRGVDQPVARAVRAVDTATHPDFQGQGVFTKLTLGAIDELATDGVDFVFNTPNDQSRPGYLKMGWRVVGRLPVRVRPSSLHAMARMASSRVPADKWSLESDVGTAPDEAFADIAGVDSLLTSQPATTGLRTNRSAAFFQWRYGLEPLAYRVLLAGGDIVDGFLVFRLRLRGGAVEAVVDDVVVPGASAEIEQRLLLDLAQQSGADYLIRLDHRRFPPGRFVPLPKQGPILTWRAVNQTTMPPLAEWDVRLGDIELF